LRGLAPPLFPLVFIPGLLFLESGLAPLLLLLFPSAGLPRLQRSLSPLARGLDYFEWNPVAAARAVVNLREQGESCLLRLGRRTLGHFSHPDPLWPFGPVACVTVAEPEPAALGEHSAPKLLQEIRDTRSLALPDQVESPLQMEWV